ncbi:MAG TPA: type II toxin-antitoxin system VapC family toxin [Nanoarchaeota archaeon]|nr:MAG: hypothetical protein QT01_C0001G0035 [archaeon GW2011_AR6]HIH17666.1 type II toxin-antitoxin system VapC family toxin [Nanoarchaeota archaeon]HIH34406.1 type II toxin-antitoxin system VapC family toxin [Nanoarchaeota archaeon]HIH51699.1 type II toxin-antitoxin system VapC family toxin [Nanoarchaeota archaeon]HIH66730.1 type II toxin-antitoxin system VapC family toxin [Nanoarchaeota archaeon]
MSEREPSKDFIDSSVFLGSLFDKDEKCFKYLDDLGYSGENIGFVSNLVFGEVLSNLVRREQIDEYLRIDLFKTLATLIDDALFQERLKNLKIEKEDLKRAKEIIEEIGHINDPADALLLAIAVNNNCNKFITIDKEIHEAKKRLSKRYKIVVESP